MSLSQYQNSGYNKADIKEYTLKRKYTWKKHCEEETETLNSYLKRLKEEERKEDTEEQKGQVKCEGKGKRQKVTRKE